MDVYIWHQKTRSFTFTMKQGQKREGVYKCVCKLYTTWTKSPNTDSETSSFWHFFGPYEGLYEVPTSS